MGRDGIKRFVWLGRAWGLLLRTSCGRLASASPSTTTTTIIMPHRVLGIDEILREVASRVVDRDPPTAVSLACCTKSFEEPALRALWKTQTELTILIKTFPPDCWEVCIRDASEDPDEPREEELIVRSSPSAENALLTTDGDDRLCRRSSEPRREMNGLEFEDMRFG